MRTLLVSPLSPGQAGNGLAHRARQWERTLRSCSDSQTVVIPVCGLGDESRGEIVMAPGFESRVDIPRLARGCTIELGREIGLPLGPIDVLVVLRSYLAEVGLGLADSTGATVLLDLDDDDADYFRQEGNTVEASRYESWIESLRSRCDRVVSAVGSATDIAVPNAVDIPVTRRTIVAPPRLLLVGNFRYAPNLAGAHWFIDEVMPAITARRPDVRLDVVGPTSEQFAPVGRGLVPDLSDFYSQASVAIVPILTGSGTRIKALEAWAHGVPVVTTTRGVEGLGATDGTDVLIADDPDRFASAVLALLDDAEWAERIGNAGRQRVIETFDAERVRADMAALVESMVGLGKWVAVPQPGMELTPAEDGLVVFDPSSQTVHHLNQSAMAVYVLADGTLTDAEIASEIADVYELDAPPYDAVVDAMRELVTSGLLVRRRV